MMLLVTQEYMIEKRALTWQECTSDIQCLDMPVLLLKLLLLLCLGFHEARPRLNNESKLCGNAEIRYNQQLKLFQEAFPRELMFISVELEEVPHSYWLNLHNITYVEVQNPFILIEEAKNSSHVHLVLGLLLTWRFRVCVWLLFDFQFDVFNIFTFLFKDTSLIVDLFGPQMLVQKRLLLA
jgi:hypothetical protein